MMAINRVHPSGAALVDALSHERVCLVGANVCVKAPPYLPPLDVTEQHARDMAMSLGQRAYPPACPVVRPMVRLCAMFEATMPDRAEEVDHAYLERLNQTIAVYGTHGVHVILDALLYVLGALQIVSAMTIFVLYAMLLCHKPLSLYQNSC